MSETRPMRTGGYLDLLRTYVGPHWRRAGLLGLLLVTSIALQLANPQLLRYVIDGAIAGLPVETLAQAALVFIGVALTHQLLSAVAQYLGEDLGWRATNALRADLALHCLRLDMTFHKGRTPGELVERIDGDVTALASFFSRFVVNVLGSVVLLVGVIVVVAREDARAGLALAAFALAALVVLLRLRLVAVSFWRQVREVSAQMFGFIAERLGGTEDIRANGAEAHVMNGLALQHRSWLAARKGATLKTNLIWATTILTFAAANAMAFGVGGYLWASGVVTLGTVYLIFHYTQLLKWPIEQLRREIEEMQRAFASIGRVVELLRIRSRLDEGAGLPLPSGPLRVELDRVTFAYEDGGEPVLHDVSLRLPPGRVLGLLGRTGSGKTTLARLLVRFYDPTDGVVALGGVDLRDASLDEVRSSATLVTQDVQLFHASVRDNVAFFDRALDDGRIAGVLERIGLGRWLRAQGDRDDGPLAAEMRAGNLSAGEAQLLAFARVFLRDPGLVILDEASSRLDPATERQIEEAIDALLAGRTGVVIAHRLATLDRCDDIVILEDGRVVEQGPRLALASDPSSRFASLLRTGLEQVLA